MLEERGGKKRSGGEKAPASLGEKNLGVATRRVNVLKGGI